MYFLEFFYLPQPLSLCVSVSVFSVFSVSLSLSLCLSVSLSLPLSANIFSLASFPREMIDSTNKENISGTCSVLLILCFQTLLRNSVDGKLLTNLPNKSLHHAELKAKHIEWAGYFKYKSK